MRILKTILALTFIAVTFIANATTVEVTTNLGKFTLELNDKEAPITTQNFLRYVKDKSYIGTQFHRVIPGFMVQGGGFDKDFTTRESYPAIVNEADNGLKNLVGTIAMARTNAPDSATRQFFINVKNNNFLNKSIMRDGYAVFGHVTAGYSVIEKIEQQPTHSYKMYQDVPKQAIIIEDMQIIH